MGNEIHTSNFKAVHPVLLIDDFRRFILQLGSASLMILCVIFSSCVAAQDLNLDFLNKIKTAKIVLTGKPDEITFRVEGRSLGGCQYIATNSVEITALAQTLKRANLKINPPAQAFLPLIGIGVYLTLDSGSEVQIFLGKEYPNELMIDGEISMPGQVEPISILADSLLYREIYKWAAHLEQIRAPEFWYTYKTEIDERSINWIKEHAKLTGVSETEEIEKRKQMYANSDKQVLESMLLICKGISQTQYYRSQASQTCDIPEFYRPIADYCSLGWKTKSQLKYP